MVVLVLFSRDNPMSIDSSNAIHFVLSFVVSIASISYFSTDMTEVYLHFSSNTTFFTYPVCIGMNDRFIYLCICFFVIIIFLLLLYMIRYRASLFIDIKRAHDRQTKNDHLFS
jgi:hypothetical protein